MRPETRELLEHFVVLPSNRRALEGALTWASSRGGDTVQRRRPEQGALG
jgi:hypothetical protein